MTSTVHPPAREDNYTPISTVKPPVRRGGQKKELQPTRYECTRDTTVKGPTNTRWYDSEVEKTGCTEHLLRWEPGWMCGIHCREGGKSELPLGETRILGHKGRRLGRLAITQQPLGTCEQGWARAEVGGALGAH